MTTAGAQGQTASQEVLFFDVNETLFSLGRLEDAFNEVGLTPGQVPLWFTRVLRDGFCLTVTGDFVSFMDVAASALIGLDPGHVTQGDVSRVLSAFSELEAHPDVEPAFRLLSSGGVRMLAVTNGSASITWGLLRRAGLEAFIERIISVDEVGSWKPAAPIYQRAVRTAEVEAAQVTMIAAHAWDCHGAQRAGLEAIWIDRLEGSWPSIFPPPHRQATDLVSAAELVLGGS